jgi:phosphoribosylanthranilate isomerase
MEFRVFAACIDLSACGEVWVVQDMDFLSPKRTSLKICGVTVERDAEKLVEMGVDAVGFNFWPRSKRYLDPRMGEWMKGLAGGILRVGVFVNEESGLAYRLFGEGMIDVVQLHGGETTEMVAGFCKAGIPVIRAVGVKDVADIGLAGSYGADAVLLDAHAPQVFGGTGETFDWSLAKGFRERFPAIPMVLAGGITPDNAALAVGEVRPCALDVASGAEFSPGVKDFGKVAALLEACVAE